MLKSNGAGAGFIPSGNPLDMEKPGGRKKNADEKRSGKAKKRRKAEAGDDGGEEAEESEGEGQNRTGTGQNLPGREVAVQRVRWNGNRGKERWIAYGGAAGIIRCQNGGPKQ